MNREMEDDINDPISHGSARESEDAEHQPASDGTPDQSLRVEFDHIGLAFPHPTDTWPLLAGALGGRFVASGRGPGYGWSQMAFANGFKIEGIHPEESSDGSEHAFVQTFIDQHGAGPHHLTFSANDLELAMERLQAIGITPLSLDHDDEEFAWSELLIGPVEGHGILVQVLGDLDNDPLPPADVPEGFPERDIDAPVASLSRVVHAVADLDGAVQLFRDGLGGHVVSSGCAVDGNHWVELAWLGGGRLRLLEGVNADIAAWIGHRRGRIRHLFFNFDEPEYIAGAEMVSQGRWVVDQNNVLGTRLVLSSTARLALDTD
ncbi:MAG: VOC family protein [Microthrixaceae bacterium]|nr:VOC family protein [Microthrixaceae bacterium]